MSNVLLEYQNREEKARTLGTAGGALIEASIAMSFDGRAAAAAGEEEETLAEMMVIVFFLFGLPLGNWLNCFRSRERERERKGLAERERVWSRKREKVFRGVCDREVRLKDEN
jgi:hypothetical protein